MNRDEKVKSLRPILNIDHADKKLIELFQNQTLRPILKFQNELTLSLLENHRNYKSENLKNTTRSQCESYLVKYIQSNLDLRNQLLGVIIALFTKSEFEPYISNRKELNKRIIQMQLKRFVDTIHSEDENP